jgi:hypothetical protein
MGVDPSIDSLYAQAQSDSRVVKNQRKKEHDEMFGWRGKILVVDLDAGSVKEEKLIMVAMFLPP